MEYLFFLKPLLFYIFSFIFDGVYFYINEFRNDVVYHLACYEVQGRLYF